MKEKMIHCYVFFFALFVFAITGIVDLTHAAPKRLKPEGTFTLAINGDLSTLDPQRTGRAAGNFILAYMFQGLTMFSSENSRPVPLLAQSLELINPTTWKFNLHKNITFHNGDPLTSTDVKFSFYRQAGREDPEFPTIKRRYPGMSKREWQSILDRIETPDPHTVIVHTKESEVAFKSYCISGSMYIVPKNYIEKAGDRPFAKSPVGCGPFKLKRGR